MFLYYFSLGLAVHHSHYWHKVAQGGLASTLGSLPAIHEYMNPINAIHFPSRRRHCFWFCPHHKYLKSLIESETWTFLLLCLCCVFGSQYAGQHAATRLHQGGDREQQGEQRRSSGLVSEVPVVPLRPLLPHRLHQQHLPVRRHQEATSAAWHNAKHSLGNCVYKLAGLECQDRLMLLVTCN